MIRYSQIIEVRHAYDRAAAGRVKAWGWSLMGYQWYFGNSVQYVQTSRPTPYASTLAATAYQHSPRHAQHPADARLAIDYP